MFENMALRFSESDLDVVLTNEGRHYNEYFQTYKFYYSMKLKFSGNGDNLIFVGDLINFHGDALDGIFERVFRACTRSVNLQHFNKNDIVDDDYVQFTMEHTDFVDYVYSSRNVKYQDLNYHVLVGGVINWLSNLAQSNRQMNVDNDWAISLLISRTSEVPHGFGNEEDKVVRNVRQPEEQDVSSVMNPQVVMDVELPHSEEEEMFGSVSDDLSSVKGHSLEDVYDDDSGLCKVGLSFYINNDIKRMDKVFDYYDLGKIGDTDLRGECLLVALFAHHIYLTQPNNFGQIMKQKSGWLSKTMLEKLRNVSRCLRDEFGQNEFGWGHWNEITYIHKKFCEDQRLSLIYLKKHLKLPIRVLCKENCSSDVQNYPTYVLRYSVEGKKSSVYKLFSCGDEGIFPNDAPCILLLHQNHFYNVWDYNSLFNEVDCPKIGRKHLQGSAIRYKKIFCLWCMVSYSNDFLHMCQGQCHCCLENVLDHVSSIF